MALPQAFQSDSLTADPEALAAAAERAGTIADQLGGSSTSGGVSVSTGEDRVLSAPVPQAAAFSAALATARSNQSRTLDGFAGFYRQSASSLAATAHQLRRGEDVSAGGFISMAGGAGTGAGGRWS